MHLDVKVIAATHKDLRKAVVRGEFREDLYHRLQVISMELQPLRDRCADFDTLLLECLQEFATARGKACLGVSRAVVQRLEITLGQGISEN